MTMKKKVWEKGWIEELLPVIVLFIVAFILRFMGGAWAPKWDNDAYIARQAEYIHAFGHPAVPDPFSSAPLYQPGMAYLLALVGWIIDLIPFKFTLPSMTIAEGLVPPLLGAGTVLVIYWFTKIMFNKSAGVAAGLLASLSHFLIFRTMKGFVFHNALSLFLIILTVLVTWKALKMVNEKPFPREFKNRISYTAVILAPAVLIGVTGFTWGGYFILHAILIFYGLLFSFFIAVIKRDYRGVKSNNLLKTWALIGSALLFGTIIALVLYPVRGPVELLRAAQMLRFTAGPLVYKSTGDLQPPGSESFEALFGTFLLLGIALTAVGAYALYKREEKSGLFLLAALLATMIPAVRAYHFIDMFSIFVYVALGIGASSIVEVARAQRGVWKKMAAVSILLALCIVFVNPVIGSLNEVRYPPRYAINLECKQAFLFIKDNTDPNALFIHWWDYGNSLAYFAQRRSVIDQMHVPDGDVRAVSAVIMGTDPDRGLQIARALKQKHNSTAVYLMLFRYDAFIAPVMGDALGYTMTSRNESIRMFFDNRGRLVGANELTHQTTYYRLWTNQSMVGYSPVYANEAVKVYHLKV
jgi:asparagine N-glycosylation enzyme membrane subunit Stt3